MIKFLSDYQEGCIPEILRKLAEFNYEQNEGYGNDIHTLKAKNLIKKACDNDNCDIHLIAGGTLTNLIVISAFLKSYEGVICGNTGHIATHETGAIELGGHKLLTVDTENGKIKASDVEKLCKEHFENDSKEHTVMPKMVYISQSTETGTCYNLAELKELNRVCKENDLIFYIDGARLLYALESTNCDFTLSDLSALSDVFYIGGTKAGALFGEALVINNDNLKGNFRYYLKQHGGLMAKGFVAGIMFEGLFENDNYKKYARNGILMADKIRSALKEREIPVENTCDTQIFATFTNSQFERLKKHFEFGDITKKDNGVGVRICTSWATEANNVQKLICAINMI